MCYLPTAWGKRPITSASGLGPWRQIVFGDATPPRRGLSGRAQMTSGDAAQASAAVGPGSSPW